MPLATYFSFLAYGVATMVLPGPNNVLLLSAAGQFGFRKCLRLMCGIWTGLLAIQLLAGTFCTVLGVLVPKVAPYFKFVGAAYILYLAWMTFRRKPVDPKTGEGSRPLTFLNGFALQFLNVKVIMLGLAAFSGYFQPCGRSVGLVLLFGVSMAACCGTGNLLWAIAGSLICPIYNRYYRTINTFMAILLVYCAGKILMI